MAVLMVTEYERITKSYCESCGLGLKKNFYMLLRDFALSSHDKDKQSILGIGKYNGEECVSAKQYVGIISFKNGDSLEIYPKITNMENTSSEEIQKSKKLLLRMLTTLRQAPFKKSEISNLQIEKMPLLEIFIKMFIGEVVALTKTGLRSGYENVEDNLNVYKGKIVFSKHIKYNFAHQEKFYVSYDLFSTNRVENKLIKSTLLFLKRISKNHNNVFELSRLLAYFDDVDESLNFDADFSKCVSDRNMQQYQTILDWCRIFLNNKSFTSYSGSSAAWAILFQMDKIFESYMASLIRKYCYSDYNIRVQDTRYYLFMNDSSSDFSLRPDIVAENEKECVILDTKWKIVEKTKDIAQSDMYQMFAYHYRYKEELKRDKVNVILVYPKYGEYVGKNKFVFKDKNVVRIGFVDMREFIRTDISNPEEAYITAWWKDIMDGLVQESESLVH